MSFLAKMFLDEEELKLINCHFSFRQDTDINGRPLAKPQGGQISLLVNSESKINFLEWMVSPKQTKDGEIIFYRFDGITIYKKLVFKDAFCVEYSEQFNAEGQTPMIISLVISAKELQIDKTIFKNAWPAKP